MSDKVNLMLSAVSLALLLAAVAMQVLEMK